MNNNIGYEMPYERCLKYGPESLTDAELLAVILRTGTRDMNVLSLADSIISPHHDYDGISTLLHSSYEDLLSVRGIGKVKAIQLLCIGEISKRLWRHESQSTVFNSPDACAGYYQQEMKFLEREELRVAFLDIKKRLICDSIMTKGTVNSSLFSVREILQEALRHRSVGIMIVHNHPGGNPSPSNEDIHVTESIREGCDAVGIVLTDHIIIGENSYFSFRERGMLD